MRFIHALPFATALFAAALAAPAAKPAGNAAPAAEPANPAAAKSATLDSGREEALLATAQAAVEDGLHAVAIRRLNEVLKKGTPAGKIRAALLVGRIRLAQKDIPAARAILAAHAPAADATPALRHACAFLRAQTEAADANWPEVLSLLAPFDAPAAATDPLLLQARWLQVRALGALGRFDEAETICNALRNATAAKPSLEAPEESASGSPVDPAIVAPSACLDLATALAAARQDDRAAALLSLVSATWPKTPWADQADLKLLALRAAASPDSAAPAESPADADPPDETAAPSAALSDPSGADPDIRVQRLHILADAQAAKTNWPAALATLDRALAIPASAPLQLETRIRQARFLLLSGDIETGTRQMRTAIAGIPDPEKASDLQLRLADTLSSLRAWDAAAAEYQIWLSAFDGRPDTPRALAGRAEALFQAGCPAEAAPLFLRAAETLPATAPRAPFLLRAAEASSAAGLHADAIEPAKTAADAAAPDGPEPDPALRAQALATLAECHLARGDAPAGEALLQTLADLPGLPDDASAAALRLAALRADAGDAPAALALYDRIASTPAWPPAARAEALRARAALRLAAGNPAAALDDFAAVARDYPATPAAAPAAFMHAWCLQALGRLDEAAAEFSAFAAARPSSPLRPDALFWLAQHDYNAGRLDSAETRFAALAAELPSSPRAPEALYWAGRAAFARREYLAANEHFNALMAAWPDSPLLPRALLSQGDTLAALGHFEAAILAFEEVIVAAPDSPEAIVAWGRKGDCQYTLGSADPARFEEALLSYRTLADLPSVPDDLRLQALYKIARYLEKAGHVASAFDHYMDVVYSYLRLPSPAPEAAVWFTRSAFAAAAIRERAGDWREAAAIYRRLAESRVPASPEALDRAEALARDHWLDLPPASSPAP
jgi:TolA-binding protein